MKSEKSSYYPYGGCLQSQGTLGTDKRFTGQRLDNTGLYYYGARYYDPTIGRFISADTVVPDPSNPQSLNRYSYCLNNPLKYIDPSGHITMEEYYSGMVQYGVAPSVNPVDSMYMNKTLTSSGITISPTGLTYNSYTGITIVEQPHEIIAWTHNFISDYTGNKYGGVINASLIVNTRVNIDDKAIVVDLQGIYNDVGNQLFDSEFIIPTNPIICFVTKNGQVGTAELRNSTVIETTEQSFWVSYSTVGQFVPSILDCRNMYIDIRFATVPTTTSDYNVEQSPTFLRPQNYTVTIIDYGLSWWRR